MDSRNQAIRALLSTMGPRRAESYVRAFDLQEDEAQYIIEREAMRMSLQQIAAAHNVSQETVKRRRRSGFQKIAYQLPDTFETLY